jgi:hypothetical protein
LIITTVTSSAVYDGERLTVGRCLMGLFPRSDQNQRLTDDQAIERYRYMLRTEPPDAIEEAHAEAFAQLTPSQRQQVLEQLGRVATPEDRRYLNGDPRSLARVATRTEMRQPGMLERLFGSVRGGAAYGGGFGMGGMLAGSLLGSVAGTFIGSAIANSLFDEHGFDESAGFMDNNDLGQELSPDTADFETEMDGGFDDVF